MEILTYLEVARRRIYLAKVNYSTYPAPGGPRGPWPRGEQHARGAKKWQKFSG